MEALPRLPMVSFDLLTTSEKVSFGHKLGMYIASFYQEDPESYSGEIRSLEGLRATAVWPSIDVNSCQMMKKYYCQLHFLKSRFPMEENQVASVYFAWKDEYTKMSCSAPDINFELMCMLVNIGCIHSKLGAEDARTSAEGMKMSCTHFQCAAWTFQSVREQYAHLVGLIMISAEQVRAMQLVCLAQAQECILEKSLLDNRKASIIAKIAVQLCDYYRQAWLAFQSGDDCLVLEHLPNHKYLGQYLQFKISYHRCIALLYQGQQAEEQQKMGERVAFYQAAVDVLDEAIKQTAKMASASQAHFRDTIAFTLDVVKGKHKAAVNENEFIYHEDVPPMAGLQEIKGASLVKGIAFSVHDREVSGADIFSRLVPMEAHEAASLYSEKKAQLLRAVGERVDQRDLDLCDFLNSLQLEALAFAKQSQALPQHLVDRAAAMVAQPSASRDLVDAMAQLSNSYHEVESMLRDIRELLSGEQDAEKQYQAVMGKRPPSIIATDLAREAAKYEEAHGKASESNLNLHKAMTTHVANIKLLAQPLGQLVQVVPTLQLPDRNVDEALLKQMQALMDKVDEMKAQRAMLWSQLRDAVHADDVTDAIVTRETQTPLDAVFQQGLDKHAQLTGLIEQNLAAQENICKAIVEAYAKFTPTRKYLQELFHKRNATIAALCSSHDSYDDLLLKAQKGIEFYAKLEANVAKLLARIKSAVNVQQEERDQMLVQNGHVAGNALRPDASPASAADVQVAKPKLKDYLDAMKEKRDSVLAPNMQYPTSSLYPSAGSVAGATDSYPAVPASTPQHYTYDQADLMGKMGAMNIGTPAVSSKEYPSANSDAAGGYTRYTTPSVGGGLAYTSTVGATTVPAVATSQALKYDHSMYQDQPGYYGYDQQGIEVQPEAAANTFYNYSETVSGTGALASNQYYQYYNDANKSYIPSTQYANYAPNTPNPPIGMVAPSPTPTPSPAPAPLQAATFGTGYYAGYQQDAAQFNQGVQPYDIYQYPTDLGTNPAGGTSNYMSYQQPVEAHNSQAYPENETQHYHPLPEDQVQIHGFAYSGQAYEYSQANMYHSGQPGSANTYPYAPHQSVPEMRQTPAPTPQPKKESSIDLLAGLDFSISQAPLVPQKQSVKQDANKSEKLPDLIEPTSSMAKKQEAGSKQVAGKIPAVSFNQKKEKVLLKGDAFKRPEIVAQFAQELDKFEKYVQGLSAKTLNGVSVLDCKWKEIQECQENTDPCKKSISVARCYPLKNRSADILPFDYSRVPLINAKDDYINASFATVGPYCMDFIFTQLPLQHTMEEFWQLVWEQRVENIVCLLSDNEINEGCYWPSDVGKELNMTRRVILAHCSVMDHWTERKLTISDEKESRLINILQFTSWPGSLFPSSATPFINFLKAIIKCYERQKSVATPVLVHCLAGVGRSGVCGVLLAALMELAAVGCPLPDVTGIAMKLSCARKNILRDREYLRFAYVALLQQMQSLSAEHNSKVNVASEEMAPKEPPLPPVDPLSLLDPLWATRRA